jgi:hypothetical protein
VKGENPTGIDLVLQYADEIRRCRTDLAEKEAQREEAEKAVVRAQGAVAAAERRLAELMSVGVCSSENCGSNHRQTQRLQYALNDESVPVVWRIGFMLAANPHLDYFGTAEAIWGPGLDKKVAKNRVNANIAQLRKLGVATALGKNTFQFDREMLTKRSKRPVEAPS